MSELIPIQGHRYTLIHPEQIGMASIPKGRLCMITHATGMDIIFKLLNDDIWDDTYTWYCPPGAFPSVFIETSDINILGNFPKKTEEV
jgi:hypothetical protein